MIGLVWVFALAASGTHIVSSGETLATIAAKNGTTVAALVETNDIADPDLILVGQKLVIPGSTPGSGESSDAAAPPVIHVVQAGDTLGDIAYRYRVSVSALVEANHLANPNRIVIGKSLTIPESPAQRPGAATPGSDTGPQLRGQRHRVSMGDTIAGVAKRYGVRIADFIRWNGLVDGKIYATTRLLLFDPGSLPASTASAAGTHTVRTGQTLSGIAAKYGVSAKAIMSASDITDPNRIYVGQTLTVPGGASGFVCPVPGGSFFNDWGFPRSNGRSHAGNDIFAPMGTPVYAPTAGLLEIATGRIGGKQFRLTGADGSLWFGSHMADFGKSGQVAAGEIIGYVGDSGNAKGGRPHLHFEVHPAGHDAVNPYPLLREIC